MERASVASLSFFAGLPEHELTAIAERAFESEFAAGDTIMQAGDFGHSLFVIEDGSAEVRIDGETVAGLGPGGSSARSRCWPPDGAPPPSSRPRTCGR